MAAKKETRELLYRSILERDGIRYEDCKVLAFVFETESGPQIFHYKLMHPMRPVYYLFDFMEKIAQVVIPKNQDIEQKIISLAENVGGKKTTPKLQ
jgi:hypothetical protein